MDPENWTEMQVKSRVQKRGKNDEQTTDIRPPSVSTSITYHSHLYLTILIRAFIHH